MEANRDQKRQLESMYLLFKIVVALISDNKVQFDAVTIDMMPRALLKIQRGHLLANSVLCLLSDRDIMHC